MSVDKTTVQRIARLARIDVAEDRLQRILCLFELIADEAVETDYRGKPIYLGLAMNAAGLVRAKPQNLLANLPLQSPQS